MLLKLFMLVGIIGVSTLTFFGLKTTLAPKQLVTTQTSTSIPVNTRAYPAIPDNGSAYEPLLTHTIADGESIAVVAQSYGIDSSLIIKVNQLSNPDFVSAGTVLLIPQYNEATKKVLLFYHPGTRDKTASDIASEVKQTAQVVFASVPTKLATIDAQSTQAVVDATINGTVKSFYIVKHNNDWQTYALEI